MLSATEPATDFAAYSVVPTNECRALCDRNIDDTTPFAKRAFFESLKLRLLQFLTLLCSLEKRYHVLGESAL
jgi:hypothetical protein